MPGSPDRTRNTTSTRYSRNKPSGRIMTLAPRSQSRASFSLAQRMRDFLADTSGVATVEFAFIAPLMATIYLGFIAVAQSAHVSGRVAQVAGTVSDLISQSQTISVAEVDAALKAGEAIAGAEVANSMQIMVVGLAIDQNKKARVQWARGVNVNNLPAKGSIYPVPWTLRKRPGFVVASRTKYTVSPLFGEDIVGKVPLKYDFYYIPRVSSSSTCVGC